jgi:hypothetical protein
VWVSRHLANRFYPMSNSPEPRMGASHYLTNPPRTMIRGVTAPNPHVPRATANGPPPPLSGCTVHAPGLKSWGGRFIWREFCLGTQAMDRLARCAANAPRTTVRGCDRSGLKTIWHIRPCPDTTPNTKADICDLGRKSVKHCVLACRLW